jgi:hypothetical protein
MIITKANLRVGFFVRISCKLNQQFNKQDPGDPNGTNLKI